MEDIRYSSLLENLIASAKKVGEGNKSILSAERFVVAVCDFMQDFSKLPYRGPDTEEFTKLSEALISAGVLTHCLKDNLLKYINSASDANAIVSEGFKFRKEILAEYEKAKRENSSVLTSDRLCRHILEEPTDAIKEAIEAARNDFADMFPEDIPQEKRDEGHADNNSPIHETKSAIDTGAKKIVAQLTQKVKYLQEELLSDIFGQDNAVDAFTTGYFQAELLAMTDRKRVRPRAIFLFAGPPGVGKTLLAEKAAGLLKRPFMRFDMSEYADKESCFEFIGSDKVYRNGKSGNVTGFVAENPKCVILFDEVEKAHVNVIHLFLQMLDAGKLRDSYTDKEVSFTDAIIIFTTNAGKQLYEQSETGDFSGISRKVILDALQKDVNPLTRIPFFPAAICSRFASGNVVMFNHIEAYNLREISKREILRHATNLERIIGISVDIDETLYTAMLFAEGGAADARMIRSRSETFFDDELYELFRMIASDNATNAIEKIEKIKITVELPEKDKQIISMFESEGLADVLVFSSRQMADKCRETTHGCNIYDAQSLEDAITLLQDNDIQVIVIDISYGRYETSSEYLIVEDVGSLSRDLFRYIRENMRGIPVYFLQTPGEILNKEEKISFAKLGIRGIIDVTSDNTAFSENLSQICSAIYQQNSMEYLAKSNKIISFETAQILSEDGKTAEIRLFDFKMSTAVDAEDSQSILSNVSRPDIHFNQVIGAEDAKKELSYFVEYLKNPKKYLGTGVRAPKGVLLYGPPGTGKTMLAKAMACESDVTFIAAEGNEFLRNRVGEGKDKVHKLFRTARKYAPAILFVDEIDAIAKERRGGGQAGANGEDVLTAFLTEMDGFKNDSSKPVFVLATTNFDVAPGTGKSLDPALMRRFDRRIYMDLPNKEERIEYIRLKFVDNPTFAVSEAQIENIAIRSTGMSLADIDSMMELALRSAIRDGNGKVTDAILEDAFETFNGGEKKKWDRTILERVARHEAGHAFLCWQSGEVPAYLTIVARGNHGGYMQHGDNEGKAIYTKEELLAKIRTALAGRASEIVYYGEKDGITTGASNDLALATKLTQKIICTYGMDTEFGLACIDAPDANMGELSSKVRTAVNAIMNEQLEQAVAIISKGRNAMDALVTALMSKNHLTGKEVDKILKDCIEKNM